MKPWFNTALLLMLFVFVLASGWQLHKRLSHLEMRQKIKEVSAIQQEKIFEEVIKKSHTVWHKQP